jgi:glycosyltransferase involved in cell wall biosynthesis
MTRLRRPLGFGLLAARPGAHRSERLGFRQQETIQTPFISVIIPVYHNAGGLALCLRALGKQSLPPERFEVIVVDNGPDLEPDRLLADFPDLRLIQEPRPGSYAARNAGLQVARGDLLAFTDSDCIPDRDWLAEGSQALLSSGAGAVGGPIDVFFARPGRPTTVELLTAVLSYDQPGYIARQGFAITANLFTCRDVMARVGPFDARLRSAGDLEWCARLRQTGYRLALAERARVAHPATRSLPAWITRVRRQTGGLHQLRRRQPARPAELWRFLVEDLRRNADYIKRTVGHPACSEPAVLARSLALIALTQQIVLLERLRLSLGGTPVR